MKVSVVERAGVRFIECVAPVTRVDDALSLIVACAENGTGRVLVESQHLPESFFDLRSLFAGQFIQKFQTYGIRLAAIFSSEIKYTDTFEASLVEARSGRQFRAFANREDAEAWLSSE